MQNEDCTKAHHRVGRPGFTGSRASQTLLMASLFTLAMAVAASAAQAFSAADIYRNSSSSVVLIFGFSDSGAGSSGTGSILTADGLVLTNNHVVTNSETGRLFSNLVVYLKPVPISGDNRKDLTTPYLVDVVARDPDLDLALLRIKDAPTGLRPIEVADSEEVEIGESVAAIGHPGGGGLWTLTTGTVSSKRRDNERDIFQTDTAINPGNSGGPLLDEYSRLVGVNTFVRRVNEQGLPLEGLNYSLRSAFAMNWVNGQGITRINAVPRTTVSNPEPSGMPPVNTQEPRVTQPAETAHLESLDEPRVNPTPEPRREPKPIAPQAAPPPAEPNAREFEGANGEKMYGVPNPTIDLHEALVEARKGYQALIERADESVDEMDRLMDDYDNF
jgi:serine protease Do